MAIKVSITSLKAAIGKAQKKADEAQASETENRILDSQIRAANARVDSAESAVTRAEMTKKEAQDKLSPPPTKQVTSDGKKGGTKTVVDEREKDKLQAQVRAADVQIQQAQSAVEDSRAEAEKLTSQALSGAGISDDQQAAMGELSDLVAQLKSAAEDGTEAELTGDEFQTKLEDAVNKSNALSESLPDEANEALNGFWEGITEGFELIEQRFTEETSAEQYEIEDGFRSSNYSQVFNDFNQTGSNTSMSDLITRLEEAGEIDPLLKIELQKAQINFMSKSDQYLAGLSDNNEESITEMMTHIREVNNKLDRDREVTDQDIEDLINFTNSTADMLGRGGDGFNTIMRAQFNSIGSLLNSDDPLYPSLRSELNSRGQTDTFDTLNELSLQLNRIDDPSNFIGLTNDDYNAISNTSETLLGFVETLISGAEIPDEDIQNFLDETLLFIQGDGSEENTGLIGRYEINQSSTSPGSNPGVPGGSPNRRPRGRAQSRAGSGVRR